MSIGSRIKEARIKNKITQGQLAEMVGLSKNAICNYEKGVSTPQTVEILTAIMKALDVDANYIYQDDFQPDKEKAPAPDESDTGMNDEIDYYTTRVHDLLVDLGYLKDGEDLSEKKFNAISAMFDALFTN